jgi:hypothetical protein
VPFPIALQNRVRSAAVLISEPAESAQIRLVGERDVQQVLPAELLEFKLAVRLGRGELRLRVIGVRRCDLGNLGQAVKIRQLTDVS